MQLPSLERMARTQAPQARCYNPTTSTRHCLYIADLSPQLPVLQVFMLHGHLRQAHATNAQLRNYNKLLHEHFERETESLRWKLAEERNNVAESIAAKKTIEAIAKDTQAIAVAEISRNRRHVDQAEKVTMNAERSYQFKIAQLEEELRVSESERDNIRQQKDALVKAFAAIANEVLGGENASPSDLAQVTLRDM